MTDAKQSETVGGKTNGARSTAISTWLIPPKESTASSAVQSADEVEALRLAALGYYIGQSYEVDDDGLCSCGDTNCRTPGKHPKGGDTRATTDPELIRQWWTERPKANLFINLAMSEVVDVSSDNPEALQEFRRLGLPPTACFQSGSGPGHVHHLYRRTEGCRLTRKCRSGELDLMSAGIAVVPPSVSGKGQYKWITPLIVPVNELPETPAWVVDRLNEQTEHKVEPPDPNEPPVSGANRDLWNGRHSGNRSLLLTLIANDLARNGMTKRAIAEALAERDIALGLRKYADRADAVKRYLEIAQSAVERFGRPTAVRFATDRNRIYPEAELDAIPAPRSLIASLIYEDSLILMAGDSASLKTFTALSMVYALTAGTDWMDRRVRARVPVLYIAAEGMSGIKYRTAALRKRHGVLHLGGLYILPAAPDLLNPPEVTALIEAVRAMPELPGLIVVDTLARTFGSGDENSTETMNRYIAALDRMRVELGCSVLVIHHYNKQHEIRGSSALRAAMDTVIELRRNDPYVTVTNTKQKNAEHFDPITLEAIKVEIDVPTTEDDDDPVQSSLVMARPRIPVIIGVTARDGSKGKSEQVRDVMLTAIQQAPGQSFTEIRKQMKSLTGCHERVAASARDQLVQLGKIEIRKEGGANRLYPTDQGGGDSSDSSPEE